MILDKDEIVVPSTIKEQVYNIIKSKIINEKIVPNSRLQEIDIAKELGVSRSPVREALKELSAEGFLVNIPNKGVFVREITKKDIIDIFELRILLEKYSIEKCVDSISENDIEELDNLFLNLEKAFKGNNVHKYIESDGDLHDTIVRLSGNKIVYESSKRIFLTLQPFRSISLMSRKRFNDSFEEHRNIIKGIKSKDAKFAWEWDNRHLNMAKDEIINYMNKNNYK